MINTLIKLSFFILFSLFCIGNASAFETSELGNRIAFLRNGDVWVVDKGGREIKQITKTSGKVEDFLFSPTVRYLAYSKIIKYVDDPHSSEEEEVAKLAVSSIVIMGLKKEKKIKEIIPPKSVGDDWIHMDKWLPDERLIFYSADGISICCYFEYNAIKNIEKKIEDREEIDQLFVADIHKDGSLMVYSSGQILRLFDVKSKKVKTLIPTLRNKFNPKISYNKEYVTWIEVDREVNGKSFYSIWTYNLKTDQTKVLYEDITTAGNLSWSFDDKFVCIFDKHYQQKAVILEIQNPNNIHKIEGKDFVWISNSKIIFAQDDKDLYMYDIATKNKELFIKDATQPVFLWQN